MVCDGLNREVVVAARSNHSHRSGCADVRTSKYKRNELHRISESLTKMLPQMTCSLWQCLSLLGRQQLAFLNRILMPIPLYARERGAVAAVRESPANLLGAFKCLRGNVVFPETILYDPLDLDQFLDHKSYYVPRDHLVRPAQYQPT